MTELNTFYFSKLYKFLFPKLNSIPPFSFRFYIYVFHSLPLGSAVSLRYACISLALHQAYEMPSIRNELIRNVCDRLLICPHGAESRNPKPISIRCTPPTSPLLSPFPLLMSGLASVHSAWLRFHKASGEDPSASGGQKVTPKKATLAFPFPFHFLLSDLLDGGRGAKFLQTKQNPLISAHASSKNEFLGSPKSFLASGGSVRGEGVWVKQENKHYYYVCVTYTHRWPLDYGHAISSVHKKQLICGGVTRT